MTHLCGVVFNTPPGLLSNLYYKIFSL